MTKGRKINNISNYINAFLCLKNMKKQYKQSQRHINYVLVAERLFLQHMNIINCYENVKNINFYENVKTES